MRFLWLIVVTSLAAVAAGLLWPAWDGLMLLAGPMLIAALWILLRRRGQGAATGGQAPVVVDGSNVMYWVDQAPSIDTVLLVLRELRRQGFAPGIVFDANAGFKLRDRWMSDRQIARALNLTEDRVLVAPKGTPADGYILAAARDLGARVVTNDRFREWRDDYPEVATPGFLICGGVRNGKVWLDDRIKEPAAEAAA